MNQSSDPTAFFLVFSSDPWDVGPIDWIFFKFFLSSKMQQFLKTIESLLTNKTVLKGTRNITTVTDFLQKVESKVLNAALEAPDQETQKVQKSAVGKKTVRSETHGGLVTNWGPH